MRALFPILLIATACGVSAENYPDKYGAGLCKAYMDCEVQRFDETYDGRKDCEDANADIVWRQLGGVSDESCPFDSDAAKQCLEDFKEAECNDLDAGTWSSEACQESLTGCPSPG